MIAAPDLAHRLTAITGFEKGSGKTTLLSTLLPLAREAGPVGIFTVGLDGRHKASAAAELSVAPGDVVMTTEALAHRSDASFEVLAAVPGRSAMGRLMLARARRGGSITLVGSEHASILADMIALARAEGWADTFLVDGAVSRVTPLGVLGEVQYVVTARLDPASLARGAERLDLMAALADLPLDPEPSSDVLRLEGPLTRDGVAGLPQGLEALSMGSFTDCFLDPVEALRFLERTRVTVRRRFHLLALAVGLRHLRTEEVLRRVRPATRSRLLLNLHGRVA